MNARRATLRETDFHGRDALRLDNGLVSALVVPEIGGRLLQFALGEHPFLFVNEQLAGLRFTPAEHQGDGSLLSWKNYGGDKTWPAPQGWERADQWPGPPDNVLDSGAYSAACQQTQTDAAVTLRSAADARTGLRIERRLSLTAASSRLQLELAFENVASRIVRWSIWDIAQLDCAESGSDCWLYVPIDPADARPWHILFGEENAQLQPDFRPGLFALNYQGIVSKIALRSPGGWLAFADQRAEAVLCMQFPHEPDAEYPDGGATVECWTESARRAIAHPHQLAGPHSGSRGAGAAVPTRAGRAHGPAHHLVGGALSRPGAGGHGRRLRTATPERASGW